MGDFNRSDYYWSCGCSACRNGNAVAIGTVREDLKCQCGGMCNHMGVDRTPERAVHISRKLVTWVKSQTLDQGKIDDFITWMRIYKAIFTESMKRPETIPMAVTRIIDKLFFGLKKDDIEEAFKRGTVDFLGDEIRKILKSGAKMFGFRVEGSSIGEFFLILMPIIAPYLEFTYIVHILSAQKPEFWNCFNSPDRVRWFYECVTEARKVLEFDQHGQYLVTPAEMFRLQDMLAGMDTGKEAKK